MEINKAGLISHFLQAQFFEQPKTFQIDFEGQILHFLRHTFGYKNIYIFVFLRNEAIQIFFGRFFGPYHGRVMIISSSNLEQNRQVFDIFFIYIIEGRIAHLYFNFLILRS